MARSTDWLANKIALRRLAQEGYLKINVHISKLRARELVAAGWAKMHPDKKRLGISSAGRDVADSLPAGRLTS